MMPISPTTWIRTSSARSFETGLGLPMTAMNAARSENEPSALPFTNSGARFASNQRVDGRHVLAGIRPADPAQESGTVFQRSVGAAGHEARRQMRVEPAAVRRQGGPDVAAVQLLECLHVVGARSLVLERVAHMCSSVAVIRTPESCPRLLAC